MGPDEALRPWYQGENECKQQAKRQYNDAMRVKLTPAAETGIADDAFKAAKEHLKRTSGLSDEEKVFLDGTASIEDVKQVVAEALAKYDTRNESSKARKWLQRASETICHYGTILDVFVQHHPEYVSLVWGSMKLLFTVSLILLPHAMPFHLSLN